jgi:hypothetical protein
MFYYKVKDILGEVHNVWSKYMRVEEETTAFYDEIPNGRKLIKKFFNRNVISIEKIESINEE